MKASHSNLNSRAEPKFFPFSLPLSTRVIEQSTDRATKFGVDGVAVFSVMLLRVSGIETANVVQPGAN